MGFHKKPEVYFADCWLTFELQDSTFEMKQAITHKDNTISALTEKIRLHMSLFSSIEKEASSVKHIVDNAQQVLREKEELGMCFGWCVCSLSNSWICSETFPVKGTIFYFINFFCCFQLLV